MPDSYKRHITNLVLRGHFKIEQELTAYIRAYIKERYTLPPPPNTACQAILAPHFILLAAPSEDLILFQEYFSGLISIDVTERKGELPETLIEYEERKLAEAKLLRKEMIEEDPKIQDILQALEASIGQIILSDDFSI